MELYLQSPNTPSWLGDQFKRAQGQIFTLCVCVCVYSVRYQRVRGKFLFHLRVKSIHHEDGGEKINSLQRWRQQGPLYRWYPILTLYNVTNQKTWTWSKVVLHI